MVSRSRTSSERQKILVVEDNIALLKVHLDLLADRFTFLVYKTGRDAVKFIQENPDIALALIDIKLPDMTGIEVLKELKKCKPYVPAIIITAFGNEHVAVTAFRCGARDYIKKPFSNDELLGRINFCLSLNVIEQGEHRKVLTNETDQVSAEIMNRARSSGKDDEIRQALRYIKNNFATDISLDRVAKTAGLSKFYFSRLFKKTIGSTYQSYLNRIRIEQAKKLLQSDTLSVTDTGYAVGYSDLTHFERIFKKLTGVTPSQYRRGSGRMFPG